MEVTLPSSKHLLEVRQKKKVRYMYVRICGWEVIPRKWSSNLFNNAAFRSLMHFLMTDLGMLTVKPITWIVPLLVHVLR